MSTHCVTLVVWGRQYGIVSHDGATVWFLFSADPAMRPGRRKSPTRLFRVVVGLSRRLLRSDGWKLLPEEIALHSFAYVKEQLERSGLPAEDEFRLTLTTQTEGARFADGPPYVLDEIAVDGAFEVPQQLSMVGARGE